MQYVVAMRSLIRDRSSRDDRKPRDVVRTHYIPAISRRHAQTMRDALDLRDGTTTHVDGPFLIEQSYEVCYVIRGADGRRLYLDQSEVEHIVSEYTAPQELAAE